MAHSDCKECGAVYHGGNCPFCEKEGGVSIDLTSIIEETNQDLKDMYDVDFDLGFMVEAVANKIRSAYGITESGQAGHVCGKCRTVNRVNNLDDIPECCSCGEVLNGNE